MKKKFVVYKGNNSYAALMVSYGLARILKENDISFTLKQNKSSYYIEAEVTTPYEDFILSEITENDLWVLSNTFNLKEAKKRIEKLNNFFHSPEIMYKIFRFYETQDFSYIKSFNKESMYYETSLYFTKSVRGSLSPSIFKLYEPIPSLSLLGYLTSGSLVKTKDKKESIFVLIPRETSIIRRPYIHYIKTMDDIGEMKRITFFSNEINIVQNAIFYLRSIEELQKTSLSDSCESILIGNLYNLGQKASGRRALILPIHTLSIDASQEIQKRLEHSNIPDQVKIAIATYIIYRTVYNFGRMIRLCSKKKILIPDFVLEELIHLNDSRLKEIYLNEHVKSIGRKLNYLNWKEKGYKIQSKLIHCSSEKDLSESLRDIAILYRKETKENNNEVKIDVNDMLTIISLIKSKEDIQFISDAILMYANVYFPTVKEEKNCLQNENNLIIEDSEDEAGLEEMI